MMHHFKQLSIFPRLSYLFLWIITLASIVRSLLHIWLPDGGAQLIATIPLDTYALAAQATIVSMFALWGLSQLLSSIIFIYVLLRKSQWLIVLWVLVLVEYVSRLLIGQFKPISTVSVAPGVIGNYLLIGLSLVFIITHLFFKDFKKTKIK